MSDPDIFATLQASTARRLFALAVLGLMGGLLIYIALATPPAAIGWQVFLLGLGMAILVLADRLRRAGALKLELTHDGLREAGGPMIAPIDRVVRVDRGMFAFKPSNGFLVLLDRPMGRAWRPGLWWRAGRRVGVGGITSASEAKAMAEIMTAMMVERRPPS